MDQEKKHSDLFYKLTSPIAVLTFLAVFALTMLVYGLTHPQNFKKQKPEWFCLGGVEWFEKTQNQIFDRSGHPVECEESDD